MTPAHEIVRKSQGSEHIRCDISVGCPGLGHDGDQPKSDSEKAGHPFWVEHGEFSQYGSLLYNRYSSYVSLLSPTPPLILEELDSIL
jgi:hypothetical protein